MTDDLQRRLVAPFYLELMGTNALTAPKNMATKLATAGKAVTPSQVVALLDPQDWRATVMGGWLSLKCAADEDVTRALNRCMSESAGFLTAPVLATTCVVRSRSESDSVLRSYVARNLVVEPESARFAAAALESVGVSEWSNALSEECREDYVGMHAFAARLGDLFSR